MDALRLSAIALKNGVAINLGNEWSIHSSGEHKIRLCFGKPLKIEPLVEAASNFEIKSGVDCDAALPDSCLR